MWVLPIVKIYRLAGEKNMNQYLIDTEFAVKSLFDLVTYELTQISTLEKELKFHRERANSIMSEAYYVTDQDVDDLETPGMFAIRHGYASHLSAAQSIQNQISILEASYLAKDSSILSLYGAILQIAKQGISFVHGKNIQIMIKDTQSGELLHNIIWQGRNQSMHYEEGNYKQPLISCFANLQKVYGSDFDLTRGDNKSIYIVLNVLGWKTYSDYLNTMTQLLP
jgi:hypothetical protein